MNRNARDIGPIDAELVKRAQRGDASAFGTLVSRYQDRIYNACYRMCRNPDDALEIAQTAYLRAWEAIPRFKGRSNFYTWLFRIVVNLVISERRQRQRRPTLTLHSPEDGQIDLPANDDDSQDPSLPLVREETRQRLAAALQRLDDEFRVPVVLKDIENMDYAGIARILGVPVGTVKSRIHRGRLMLRAIISEQEQPRGRVRM